MASANEVETQGENGHVGHLSSERQTVAIQDVGYFSSSPLESPPRSPFSTLDTDLSLGVFFSPDEGEANDVLAAMRASQRVVKETREAVMGLRPRTEQIKEFTETLHTQVRDFAMWIYDGVGISRTTRIEIRSLPMFAKLVVYVNILQDLHADLPYVVKSSSTPSTRGTLLRRFSTPILSSSRTNSHSDSAPSPRGDMGADKNPRLAVAATKVVKSFAALQESVDAFMEEQRKSRASRDVLERTRKELGISHDLCLQGTRQSIKSFIKEWIGLSRSSSDDPAQISPEALSEESHSERPSPEGGVVNPAPRSRKPILVLTGPPGSGKSALATTLACEWKRSGMLGAHIFVAPSRPTDPKRSSTGKRSSADGDSDTEKVPRDSSGTSLSKALSRIAYRHRSSSSVKMKAKDGNAGGFIEALGGLSTSENGRKRSLVVVDGIDHAGEEDEKRLVEAVRGAVERDVGLRVFFTTSNRESSILGALKDSDLVEFVPLEGTSDGDGRGGLAGDADDIRRYIASQLAVLLGQKDQQRVLDAVQGNFADAVRICKDVAESGAPERSLDGILYHEAVRRHGIENVRAILL